MGNRADRKQLAARFRGKEGVGGGGGFCPHHTQQAEDERKQLKCIIFFSSELGQADTAFSGQKRKGKTKRK